MTEPLIGTVMLWAPNFAPRGWMFCKGQIMQISMHQALFSLIGTTYGGDGITSFQLPNLQGRAPVGEGNFSSGTPYTLGQPGGSENVTLMLANMPAHTHSAQFSGSQNLNVNVSLKATTNAATKDVPESGLQLGDVAPNSTKVYAPAGGTEVDIVGGTGTVSGTIGGTVTVMPAGSNIPFSVVSPYVTLNYIIALQGIFPTRD